MARGKRRKGKPKEGPAGGKPGEGSLTIARNRRATYDYEILDRFEAGLVLTGSEIKSLRQGKGSIAEAYIRPDDGELLLVGANIPRYESAAALQNHEPTRPRKLLLHKKEIAQALAAFEQRGLTLVPISLFINARGLAKLAFGIGRGKRQYEKRESIAKREAERAIQAGLRRSSY